MLKKIVSSLIIGLLVIGLILGGMSCVGEKEVTPTPDETKPVPTPTKEVKEIKITASQLIEEYQANEIAADHKYKGRIIALEGKIVNVSRDPKMNKPYIAVTVRGKYSGDEYIRCFFNTNENELLGLTKREEVIIKGKCLGKKEKEEGTSFPIILESCSLLEETEFQMAGWQVTLSGAHAGLEISYKKFGYSLRFNLTNPKGIEVSTASSSWGITKGKVHLPLTECDYENPLPGQYKLSVEATKLLLKQSPSVQDAKLIATETFNFSGPHPEMEVMDKESHWAHPRRYGGPAMGRETPEAKEWDHYWVKLEINIKNSGDLPFCFNNVEVLCEGSSKWYLRKVAIAPGEEETISISTDYYFNRPRGLVFYSPGKKIVTCQFRDQTTEIVYSLNPTITVPEKPPVECAEKKQKIGIILISTCPPLAGFFILSEFILQMLI